MLFFRASWSFQSELTALYDFVNPTAAAMWNLRWQVAGYVAEAPTVKLAELQARFVTGSGIGSANLRRHCVESSWDAQLNQLGALTLYQAIGHLEGWVDSLDIATEKKRKALMFPSTSDESSAHDFLDGLQRSPRMKQAFGPTLTSYKHCFPDRLEDLLTVLRAYKVARNHITRSGGRVKDSTHQALADARAAAHGLGHGKKDLQLPTIDEDGRVVVGLLAAQGAAHSCTVLSPPWITRWLAPRTARRKRSLSGSCSTVDRHCRRRRASETSDSSSSPAAPAYRSWWMQRRSTPC